MEQTESILQTIREMLVPPGFEIYPFKVGWYNTCVEDKYKLPCHDDTLGVLIIGTPESEKAFIPFVKQLDWDNWKEDKSPLRECLIYHFDKVAQKFTEHDIEVMHQFEKVNGQARILVQTAAHVSGAAYYYQRRDVTGQPWSVDQKIYGACYHPTYGFWISFDGVFIFKDVLCPDLPQQAPKDIFPNQKERVKLLNKFNSVN